MSIDDFKAFDDAHARAVYKAFEDLLKPFMAQATPDWLLHHMEIRRQMHDLDHVEEVHLRLVLRTIGSVRAADPEADLRTGFRRLERGRRG